MNTEYKILSYYDAPQQLETQVNILLSKGWKLYGNLQVAMCTTNGGGTIYSQAMIRVTTSDYARTELSKPNKTRTIKKS